ARHRTTAGTGTPRRPRPASDGRRCRGPRVGRRKPEVLMPSPKAKESRPTRHRAWRGWGRKPSGAGDVSHHRPPSSPLSGFMRLPAFRPPISIASAPAVLGQQPRVPRIPPSTIIGTGPGGFRLYGAESRAVIGVSTSSASTSRDTLGVLVATVRTGSPAEK